MIDISLKDLKLFALIIFSFHVSATSSSLSHGSGLVNMPSAKLNSEGYISFNYSSFYPYQQYRFNFSPYDSVEASLFYTDINSYRYDFSVLNQSYKDKGFAFRWRLPKFLKSMPDTVIGFEDFAGTGITSSEFIASTINLKQTDVTLGLGWGRLGSKDTIKNPFSILSKKFKN
ncbi:MAG: hypothetical protein CMF41_05130, partial [Legionellales bacterium]